MIGHLAIFIAALVFTMVGAGILANIARQSGRPSQGRAR